MTEETRRPMLDLREGCTPAAHAVLDLLDEQQKEWGDLYSVQQQIKMAHARAKNALYAADDPNKQRRYAVEAAARLIDAINELDREGAADAALTSPKEKGGL